MTITSSPSFAKAGTGGAISKTNHGVLRYREPIYKSIRELAMSYFHEYFLNDGRKTLRSFSNPVDLSRLDRRGWMTSEEDVFYVPEYIDSARHFPILTHSQLRRLRRADAIERTMGNSWSGLRPGKSTDTTSYAKGWAKNRSLRNERGCNCECRLGENLCSKDFTEVSNLV